VFVVLGQECVWVRVKGKDRGSHPDFIRAERGRRGSGEGAAAGALSIDGRRRCDIKKEGKRGNRRIWRGKQVRGSRLLIEACRWKGKEAEEAGDEVVSRSVPAEQRKGRGHGRKEKGA
jgi:hypothetical protein